MKRDQSRLKALLFSSCALTLTGCMSLAAIEPVKNPPADYQADVSVQVEFLHPAKVGPRCAQRGVSIFGMPAPSAMACANTKLMTIPNACDTVTGGWYAEAVCAAIGHTHGWDAENEVPADLLMPASWSPDQNFGLRAQPKGGYRAATAIRVEFVEADKIGLRCAERGAVAFGRPTLNSISCSNAAMMTLPNPCSVVDGGWYADLLCHEMGHANGWPANHPGGSFLKDGRVPGSHTLPVDEGSFLMNFVAAVEVAKINSRRSDPVRATTLASLADSPQMAEQIALKAGIRPLPDLKVPRIEQIPEFTLASFVLPLQRASLTPGPDFSKPMMGPGARRQGLRLTRARLEALFNASPETGSEDASPAVLSLPDAGAGRSLQRQVHAAAWAPGHAAGTVANRLRMRGSIQVPVAESVHIAPLLRPVVLVEAPHAGDGAEAAAPEAAASQPASELSGPIYPDVRAQSWLMSPRLAGLITGSVVPLLPYED